jgi:hypothetical protein
VCAIDGRRPVYLKLVVMLVKAQNGSAKSVKSAGIVTDTKSIEQHQEHVDQSVGA